MISGFNSNKCNALKFILKLNSPVTIMTVPMFIAKLKIRFFIKLNSALKTLIDIDEFTLMGKEKAKLDKSNHFKKKKAVIDLELTNDHKTKKGNIKTIDDYSAKYLSLMPEEHINEPAKTLTEKRKVCEPLKLLYNMKQLLCKNGANLKQFYRMLMLLRLLLIALSPRVHKWYIKCCSNRCCCISNCCQSKQIHFIELSVK